MMRLQLIRRNMLRASIHSTLILMLSAPGFLLKRLRKNVCRTESSGDAAYTDGDGRCIFTALYERLSPCI